MKESSRTRVAKALGVIFLLALAGLLVIKILQQGIYSSKLGMNIVIVGKETMALLLLRPEEDVVGWVAFPRNLKVKIYNSDARYPVNSLWSYGVLVKNPYEVVEKTVGLSMGVVVAKTIRIEAETSIEGVLKDLYKIGLKTNLSLKDRLMIRKFLVETVASKKLLEMDMPTKIFDKQTEPDGQEFVSFNSVASLWTKNKFVLESILSENVDLVVNNLTGQSGLGTQVARQLESTGMRVIEVKSDQGSEVIADKGCFFSVSGKYPFTESLLVQQMNCLEFGKTEQEGEKGITVWLK